jgi:hypothetical protein
LGSLPFMRTLLPLALMVALPAAPAAASATTLVSFTQSGGLAGINESVTVTTTGHVVVDGHGGDRSRRLRTTTLRHLRELLADARWDRANPGRSRCADCFEYLVRYHGHRARYDDSQAKQVPRSVRAVVAEMQRISRGGR